MNEFSSMVEDGCLLTSGNLDDFNTMTIGWAQVGHLWQKEVATVYVRPNRYTHKFMDKNDYFTLAFFYPRYKKTMSYLGTVSGKDVDKVKESKLTPIKFGESVGFKEAYMMILCKKIYKGSINLENVTTDIQKKFYSFGEVHDVYVGEIIETKTFEDI